MAIKASGTLRRKFNEALDKKILCRNGLLMALAAMQFIPSYSNEDKVKVAKILIDNGTTKEDILKIIPQIEKDYTPKDEQVKKVLSVISGKYTYRNDYIENKLLRTVKPEDLGTVKVKKRWKRDGPSLKQYIYENELVEDLLEELGCEKIRYHSSKEYWSCANPDGDNPTAVNVQNNSYLGVKNWTREDDFDDRADILTLVQHSRNCSYFEAYDYICDVLEIDSDLLPKTKVESKKAKKKVESEEERELTVLDEKELKKYIPCLYRGWIDEGIMPCTRDKFDIRWNPKQKSVVIPIRHWKTGQLVAINQRNTIMNYDSFGVGSFEYGKYSLTKGYQKSLNLYGLYENRKDILEKGLVVVYEAEKSVLKRDTRRDPTGVALGGHSLSKKQAEILLSLDVDIIISMDKDVPIEEVWHMCDKLYQKNENNIYYTIDNHGLMGPKDSIADLKMKDYDMIFSEKVLYGETERKKLETYLGKALS